MRNARKRRLKRYQRNRFNKIVHNILVEEMNLFIDVIKRAFAMT